MNWDKYIGLVDTLGLDYCDLRKITVKIYDNLRIDNEMLGRLEYFTPGFYINLLKISKYIKDKFVERFGEFSLSIHIKEKDVEYLFGFNDVNIRNCIELQSSVSNILGMETRIMFGNPSTINNRVKLFIEVVYHDKNLKNVIDKLDISKINDMLFCDRKEVLEIEEKNVVNAFKFLRDLKENDLRDFERFVYTKNYINIAFKVDNKAVEISYNSTKDTEQVSYTYFDDSEMVFMSRQILGGMDTGVEIQYNDKKWRL